MEVSCFQGLKILTPTEVCSMQTTQLVNTVASGHTWLES